MSIGISENFKKSFAFTKENLIGKILNWVILFVILFLMADPLSVYLPNLALLWAVLGLLACFIFYGLNVRIYAGGDVSFKEIGTLLKKGLGVFVVSVVYFIIPLLLLIIGSVLLGMSLVELFALETAELLGAGGVGLVLILISFLLCILVSLIYIPVLYTYANEGMRAALNPAKVFGCIKRAGVLKYLVSIFIFFLIAAVVGMLILLIPFVGIIVAIILEAFIRTLEVKYFANLLG